MSTTILSVMLLIYCQIYLYDCLFTLFWVCWRSGTSLYSQKMFTHCSLCTVCTKMTFNKILINLFYFRWSHDSD